MHAPTINFMSLMMMNTIYEEGICQIEYQVYISSSRLNILYIIFALSIDSSLKV